MRYLFILCVAFLLAACSKPSGSPLPNFDPYLSLPPGTKVKVVPYIGGFAADIPGTGNKMKQIESGTADIGTVVSVTKRELNIRMSGSNTDRVFAPEDVRSIEVLKD